MVCVDCAGRGMHALTHLSKGGGELPGALAADAVALLVLFLFGCVRDGLGAIIQVRLPLKTSRHGCRHSR